MKPIPLLLLCGVATLLLAAVPLPAAEPGSPPRQLRIVGPDVLERGTRTLVYAEGTSDGRIWKPLDPDHFRVRITGAARLVDDPAGKPMNPFEVRGDGDSGKVTIEVQTSERSARRTFPLGSARPTGSFEVTLNPAETSHRFAGLGGGVLFYDNQFDITRGDDIYDWCFRDVHTTFLHVLIRPGYEKQADAGDWRSLDLARFDFRSLERPFRIVRKARERNPDLKIYASLYSPPPWLKTNGTTGGHGSLREGPASRQQLAKYLLAYLKHAQAQGIPVDYLGFFNEPDWPHTQEGMHFADLGTLAETFHDVARDLDSLIAAEGSLKNRPLYVFPDTLGAGSLTRAGPGSRRLRERARLLSRVDVWGVHDYWNQAGNYWHDRFHELRAFPGVGTRPIWVTEWAQRSRHGDLASGVEYGVEMLNALRLGAEAWMVFEWCHPSGNQSGLISTDWDAKPPRPRYWRSQAYHVFRQIANTSPAGSRVLAVGGRWTGKSQANGKGVEYLALRAGDKVVVHLMNTEPAPVTYRLHLRAAPGKTEGRLTSPLAASIAAGPEVLTVRGRGSSALASGVIPANSLLSVVLHGEPSGS